MSSASTTWAVGRDGRLMAIAEHEPQVETRTDRVSGVAGVSADLKPKQVSLPRISALSELAEAPSRSRPAPPITPICADKQARLATIRACHRKMARAGMFDHCRYQQP